MAAASLLFITLLAQVADAPPTTQAPASVGGETQNRLVSAPKGSALEEPADAEPEAPKIPGEADRERPPQDTQTPDAPTPPSEAFSRGEVAFARGEYDLAIRWLRPLLYPRIRLETEGQVVQSHRMLGVAHLFEDQRDRAAEEFVRLLELRPDYRFDPLLDPPGVVDFFNEVLRSREAEIAELEARRQRAKEEAKLHRQRQREALQPQIVERTFARNSYLINFVPFGAGQFQNGQDAKGTALLVSESVLAAVSLGAFATNLALFGLTPRLDCNLPGVNPCPEEEIDRTDERLSENLLTVQVVSGGLFFAVAAWGIVDALVHYEPFKELHSTKRSQSDSTKPSSRRTQRGGWASARLVPTLVGGRIGPGFAMTF